MVKKELGFVYFLQDIRGPIKIGFTKNLKRRIITLQTGNPFPLELIGLSNLVPVWAENYLHRKFHPHKINGEWFRKTRCIVKFARNVHNYNFPKENKVPKRIRVEEKLPSVENFLKRV